MWNYRKLILGELRTNCYLLWIGKSQEAVVIDPADESEEIILTLSNLRLSVSKILLTHGHFDHTLAALDLKLIYGSPIAVSNLDFFLLKRQNNTANFFLKEKVKTPNIKKVDIDLNITTMIKINEKSILSIRTPGHTPGGVCFYVREAKWLFCGDLIFKNGILGDFSHKYSDSKKLHQSVVEILQLPDETILFPGHGEADTIGNCRNRLLNLLN